MNVLAIGCHPDDIEVACAGTLAKYVKQGHNVTVCHVCNGNLGHAIIQPDELRTMRAQEARNAGALAGIKVVTCDVGDLLAYPNQEQRDRVEYTALHFMIVRYTYFPKGDRNEKKELLDKITELRHRYGI